MLELILDNIIVLLSRTVVRLIREYRGATWPLAMGRLEESTCLDSMHPAAELADTYIAEGREYQGTSGRGSWFKDAAKRYADEFTQKSTVVVRYNSHAPAKSVLRERDQHDAIARDFE